MAALAKSWRRGQAMDKPKTKLNAQDRVILFWVATGIGHAAVGILTHAMQSMAIRGFIANNRETESMHLRTAGAALAAILEDAGLTIAPK
jgi:hypothetical protein